MKTQLQKNKFVQKNRTRNEKKFASTAAKPKEKEKLRPQTQLVNGENQADIAVQERRFNAAFTLHRALGSGADAMAGGPGDDLTLR